MNIKMILAVDYKKSSFQGPAPPKPVPKTGKPDKQQWPP